MSFYTEDQIRQLTEKLKNGGFTPEEVAKLGQFDNFFGLRGLLRGTHELKQIKHVINCNARPFCPDGWEW
jgi:hypothetical protein